MKIIKDSRLINKVVLLKLEFEKSVRRSQIRKLN